VNVQRRTRGRAVARVREHFPRGHRRRLLRVREHHTCLSRAVHLRVGGRGCAFPGGHLLRGHSVAYADDDIIDIDPSSLTVYYERPEEETRAYIADALLSAYARDRAVLSRKKRRLVVAVRCFLAQIARLAVLLVVTAIVR